MFNNNYDISIHLTQKYIPKILLNKIYVMNSTKKQKIGREVILLLEYVLLIIEPGK